MEGSQNVARLVASFQAAGVGAGSWTEPLNGLADLTGSKHGQLVGFGNDLAVQFNWFTRAPAEFAPDLDAVNGLDPRVNPRVRAGLAAPEMAVLATADFPHQDEEPGFVDFVRRYDVPYICLGNLIRDQELTVGLAVVRSRAQDHASPEQRRLFAEVAPHVRKAVRTQMLLQSEAAALVAGAMEALSLAVFVCDSGGRVRAMSANAEALLAGGEHLRLKDRRLEAIGDADTRALAAMVQGAAFAQQLAPCRPPTVLVLRSKSGRDPLLLEVSSVPGAIHNFGFGVAALVIARGSRRVERRSAQLASALYGLTQAEAAVAADLVDGLSPAAIAQRAGVSLHTIRTHIKRILEKADVHSQVEFVSSISARL